MRTPQNPSPASQRVATRLREQEEEIVQLRAKIAATAHRKQHQRPVHQPQQPRQQPQQQPDSPQPAADQQHEWAEAQTEVQGTLFVDKEAIERARAAAKEDGKKAPPQTERQACAPSLPAKGHDHRPTATKGVLGHKLKAASRKLVKAKGRPKQLAKGSAADPAGRGPARSAMKGNQPSPPPTHTPRRPSRSLPAFNRTARYRMLTVPPTSDTTESR
ncbi:hypothetical protein JB92DRAFT_3119127 [Gautieria morchelliformis]|nr:hypothetical protein JB92DRAFT_3119127 [Gautieria morchelliformis]